MWWIPTPSYNDGPANPILRPGTPVWQGAFALPAPTRRTILPTMVMFAVLIGWITFGGLVLVAGHEVIGAALLVGALAAPIIGWYATRGNVIGPPNWRYEGVSIDGEALTLLADIQGRFDYAERLIGEVPAGMDWAEVRPHTEQLLWEAAGHAARVSALDVEMSNFRYAASGTPQMALKKALEERRGEHWDSMRRVQTEADSLARAAGNAAAAAKIALARTGDIRALEVVAPSGRSLLAFEALSEARARLQLLADVWAELDESTLILQERIDHERRHDS